ncbi:hypothetical protein [Burkholderia cenocepacia]|uniref:hypothetical protein n=1 Tax=Burkholderia cenocepacia TaxID=95486 RepID=UPI0022309A46|nr:hypothetical protein [Burkholderia cenocepacia]MCW5155508.1 hypothetical protein [Burkholderia cenocepacia]MCW5158097.1 hypothetical protein [Burkholderia cenocepacia]MCW5164328.1 hypothetical protein [Burkholderia cenocepacia]
MDPVSALTIGSAAISTVGAISGGMAKSAQANQQAAALDRNAALSDQQATQVYAQNVNRETAQRAQAAQQLGEQRAAVAESGFNPNSGSALDTQVQSVRNAELDALQTRYQGILQGQSLEDQAQQDRYAARTARANARNSLVAGGISAAASLLGGVAQYGKSSGLFGGVTNSLKSYGTTGAGNPILFTM